MDRFVIYYYIISPYHDPDLKRYLYFGGRMKVIGTVKEEATIFETEQECLSEIRKLVEWKDVIFVEKLDI